jgi:hypothetical protein
MSSPTGSSVNGLQVLQREFLDVRVKLLELAAFFDRLDRAGGVAQTDPHLLQLRRGLALISQESETANRAEQLLLHFSRPYEADWRDRFSPKRQD